MKRKILISLAAALCLLLGACAQTPAAPAAVEESPAAVNSGTGELGDVIFSDRDLRQDYDSDSPRITLSSSGAQCQSSAVEIGEGLVRITDEGCFILSGSFEGQIVVEAEKSDKVQLVLDGVDISCADSACIYVLQADKLFLTLAPDSVNSLSNGGSFAADSGDGVDGVIFSKDDITLGGSGSLSVSSPAGHGIVSKDELTVTGGEYRIVSASHGLSGKDCVSIVGAAFDIESGKDCIHSENADDSTLGFAHIESGTFCLRAEGDGISGGSYVRIVDGEFDIVSGGGSENAKRQTSEGWGAMPGMPGGGGRGPMPPGDMGGRAEQSAEEDSTSMKAVKAGTELNIGGGSFSVDSADDAFHSNGSLSISGGTFDIATGDDGFHADETLSVSDGRIEISRSYEGLEGLSIDFSGGEASIVSDDDGLNAAGGMDMSGFGGHRGGDSFGAVPPGSSDSYISISGGSISMRASGDGIDSNGSLSISGGSVLVCGPTMGDTAVLDYETVGSISGGSFIGTGAYMMAQTFSESSQGVYAVSVGNQRAGTLITLADEEGNVLVSHEPEMDFAIVIISTPQLVKGETYTITVGQASGSFEAS